MMDWFWDESLWFPENLGVGWADLENKPGAQGYYPRVRDLNWSLVIAVGILAIRYVVERTILIPLGYYLGVQRRRTSVLTPHPILEAAYKQKQTSHKHIQSLIKTTDLSERQIQRWFRKRKQKDTTKPILKFSECGWLFTFYTLAFYGGLYVLWDKPWLTDTKHNWMEWPNTFISDGEYWYYILECAFYWSLVFSLCYDNQRKDFKEMIIHHIATLFLLYFSWMMNFVRVGTLVLLSHDAADPLLAFAKMCSYTTLSDKYSTGCFIVFLVVWVVSRLYFYPFVVLYSTTVEPFMRIEKTCFAHLFFNSLLYALMVLHLMWTYSIFKIAFIRMKGGEMEDIRSDTDELGSDNFEKQTNGSTVKSNNNDKT